MSLLCSLFGAYLTACAADAPVTCRLWPAGAKPPVVGWYVNALGGKCAPLVTTRNVYFCGNLILPADPWYAWSDFTLPMDGEGLLKTVGDAHHCTYDLNGLTLDSTKDYYWAAARVMEGGE